MKNQKSTLKTISFLAFIVFLWTFSINITLAGVPGQPSVITGNTTVCQGSSEAYSVINEPGVTYNWTYSGSGFSISSGQGTNSIQASFSSSATSGTLTVTPSNTSGTGSSRSQMIDVITVPSQPSVITGNSTVCQGSTETFSVIDVSDTDYDWTYSGSGFSITSGQGTHSISASFSSSATAGTLTVTPSNTCGSGSSQTMLINITELPDQPSLISGNMLPCVGTSETYSVTDVTGVDYNWTYSGQGFSITSGQGTHSIVASFSSSATPGTLTVTPSNTCGDGQARVDTILVINETAPDMPSLIIGNFEPCIGASETYFVYSEPNVIYDWTFPPNWTQTGGGNTHSVTVTVGSDSGNISVIPSNHCGIGAARDSVVSPVVCTGIWSQDLPQSVFIYPNPVIDKLNILLDEPESYIISISIFDVSGRKVLEIFSKDNHETKLDLSNLDSGIYHISIVANNYEYSAKFIKK